MTTHRLRDPLVVVASLSLLGAGLWALGEWEPAKDRPDEWDPRVMDIAAFVADELDAEFEHPVPIRFVPDDEFEEMVRSDEEELTPDDQDDLRDQEAIGRAFGLFSGETDLFAESNDLAGSGILAYYSPDDEEIVARVDDPDAAELPVDLRVTIAHEMTHVWQDQRYDLTDVQDMATTSTQADAIQGLIEGHATWLEDRYIEDLSEEDAAAYDEAVSAGDDEYTTATTGVTPVLEALQVAPYALGPTFVTALVGSGDDLVERAFTEEPPRAEDQLVLPSSYLDGDEPDDLDDPQVPDGADEIDRDQMGMPALHLMLTVGLEPPEALAVADGWGNDAYVAYRQGGQVCVRLAVTGDSDDDTAAIERGLRAWADAMVAEADAEVERGDDAEVVLVTSCDPGADVDQDVPGDAAIEQLFGRAYDLGLLLDNLPDEAVAECIANEVYTEYTVDELYDDRVPQDQIDAVFESCGIR